MSNSSGVNVTNNLFLPKIVGDDVTDIEVDYLMSWMRPLNANNTFMPTSTNFTLLDDVVIITYGATFDKCWAYNTHFQSITITFK